MNSNLKLIRSLLSEIRKTASENKIRDNIVVRYVMAQAREHQETSETLCKAREELQHLAKTYNCYLSSLRSYNELNSQYSGAGERSVRETADLVGFKLPHDPK
ncbi:protein FMC1 homolog isoform X2 [Microplitis mediator]|uniref:protein FMC1 homolog isoform X2 n=1 Tax=Microplitis mediator TaxID=375433 RepID=UPI002557AA23|nr:protein FMC1 homolog isoform X2 [Microplitis mediator]XP_057332575.1 protein FMC1 homolog isoform X2 [Microplitis mediator]